MLSCEDFRPSYTMDDHKYKAYTGLGYKVILKLRLRLCA